MRFNRLLSVSAILFLAVVACAQGGDRGSASATIKGKKVSIDYGRPELKGRDMLGKAPVGAVWRLGANQATHLETEAGLKIGSTVVPAGKYTLWLKRASETDWSLGIHPKTGVWGLPVMKDGYVAELPLKSSTATNSEEKLTITLSDAKGKGNIKIQWGTAVMTGEFDVQ
jgi:hypothetical protein